jgi:hypothetical protein
MRPGYMLMRPVRALLCSPATVLRAALPRRGVLDGHAVPDLAFPPLFGIGPREAMSSGRETRRGRCQCTPPTARRARLRAGLLPGRALPGSPRPVGPDVVPWTGTSPLSHQRRFRARLHLERDVDRVCFERAVLGHHRLELPRSLVAARARPWETLERAAASREAENYPGRGFTWRCSCQSSPAASSASCTRCHAAPSDSSRRMRTCPRSLGIGVAWPSCLATAASSSLARPPGRVTWTTIAVSGTKADRSQQATRMP